jgi:hypothetical protein
MTNKTAREKKSGLMGQSTMVSTCRERSMGEGSLLGQMGQFSMVISRITISKGMGRICGLMDVNTLVIGKAIRWTDEE